MRDTVGVPVNREPHGPAADLAILDILLHRAAARVYRQLDLLAATGALDPGRKIGDAVAEGKGIVEVFAHRSSLIDRRSSQESSWHGTGSPAESRIFIEALGS
jgi:hypothetical protein